MFAEEKPVRLDYFEIVDKKTLQPADDIRAGALIVVAAYVGKTRLIDNISL